MNLDTKGITQGGLSVLPFSYLLVCPVVVTMCILSSQHHQQFRWDREYHPSWGSKDICKWKTYFGTHGITSCKLAAAKMWEIVWLWASDLVFLSRVLSSVRSVVNGMKDFLVLTFSYFTNCLPLRRDRSSVMVGGPAPKELSTSSSIMCLGKSWALESGQTGSKPWPCHLPYDLWKVIKLGVIACHPCQDTFESISIIILGEQAWTILLKAKQDVWSLGKYPVFQEG